MRTSSVSSSTTNNRFSFLPKTSDGSIDLKNPQSNSTKGKFMKTSAANLGQTHEETKSYVSTVALSIPDGLSLNLDNFNV
jgi:hypothetical protein